MSFNADITSSICSEIDQGRVTRFVGVGDVRHIRLGHQIPRNFNGGYYTPP